MRCPEHPYIWLYENMMETKGFCPECQKWYELLAEQKNKDITKYGVP